MCKTIAAISTAPGVGGIGIVRVSGPKTFDLLDKCFVQKKPKKIEDIKGYSIKYGVIVDSTGKTIDEVLVSYFKSPKSYTTENMCEISSHGGMVVINEILRVVLECGATLAEPGEFTKRAFLNGRIDLTQAEAVTDVINAKTDKERAVASSQLEGGLSKKISSIKDDVLEIMSDIEASIDYPEYDIEEVSRKNIIDALLKIDKALIELEKSSDNGKLLKEGISTSIVGRPNSGKSSLLNLMLNEDRAIVTEIEGTTRDTIEEYISINGVPLKIVDTAGIRETDNEIEKLGVEKSLKAINESDIVICMFDITKMLNSEDKDLLDLIKDKNVIYVLNKCDLNKDVLSKIFKDFKNPCIKMSAKTGEGLDDLYNEISKLYDLNDIGTGEEVLVTNLRHLELIKRARENAKESIDAINKGVPIDIVSSNIREILEALNEITGESVTDDIIDKIFSKFCLGK